MAITKTFRIENVYPMGDNQVAVVFVDQNGLQSFHLFDAERFARVQAGAPLNYEIPAHELDVPVSLLGSLVVRPRRVASHLLKTP